MDKRDLARLFRDRLRSLIELGGGGLARFARETGVDRSAVGQFLDPEAGRLPRAETLRAIAEAKGVSADWLLGLANAEEREPALASDVEIESAFAEDGDSPLERWRREAAGSKLRYVPTSIPDMLQLPEIMSHELAADRAAVRFEHGRGLLGDARLGDLDVEIAMPIQRLRVFARGAGLWEGIDAATRRAQLEAIAERSERDYPRLRLHLYDARRLYAPPFTVFGMTRAALYLGRAYLVLTATEQVRALANHFDDLVRESAVAPPETGAAVREIATLATG